MVKNKRKTYAEAMADGAEIVGGIPCAKCGCRHNYVIRTEKIGATIRRTRQCRNCGWKWYTTETA